MKFAKAIVAPFVIFLGTFANLHPLYAAFSATSIYDLAYPVGLAEDASGNIYISDDHNPDSMKLGIVVVPATSGNLFGQSVTAGIPLTLVNEPNTAGVAVGPTGTLVWSMTNGNIYALASSNRNVFGTPVSANTPTLISAGTGLRGALDFDSLGNLYGVHVATGEFSVLPVSSGTLYGIPVTANTSEVIFSDANNWFWDLAIDSAGNIFVADGWGLQGVFVMPVATGNLYGQPVTANTFSKITAFGTARYAGIDIDSSNILYANLYSGMTNVLSPTTRTAFQTPVVANIVSTLTSTSGYIDQGLLVTSSGDLITGGPDKTYRLVASSDLSEPGAPTIGTATVLSPSSATVSFIAPASDGGATITYYTATSTPGSITGRVFQSTSGSITLTGLSASTSYTFSVTATNSSGTSSASGATVSITMPASQADIDAAARAEQKAADAKRAAEKRSARKKISNGLIDSNMPSLELFSIAEITGVTDKNMPMIGKELMAMTPADRSDIKMVEKVSKKYLILDSICIGGKFPQFFAKDLSNVGLIPVKNQAAVTYALRQLPLYERENYEKITAAISKELEIIRIREERLAAVVA